MSDNIPRVIIPSLFCPKLYQCSTFLTSDDADKKKFTQCVKERQFCYKIINDEDISVRRCYI